MLRLNWIKCGDGGDDGHWCDLQSLALENITTKGVYVIWHEGTPGQVVRIGQGGISSRLAAHRYDDEILAYAVYGTLRVTWAVVPAPQRDGVERYLAGQFPPLVGDVFPDVEPIAVNSPW